MVKFAPSKITLAAVLTATAVVIIIFLYVPSTKETKPSHDDTAVGEILDWCLRKYERTDKRPTSAISHSHMASLAQKIPLPSKVSSLESLFQAPWRALVVWEATIPLVREAFTPRPGSFTLGVAITAIGKYVQFLEGFLSSADKYFMTGERLTYVIFTDHVKEAEKVKSVRPKLILREENMGWPRNTLMRFHLLNKHSEEIGKFDYVYVLDVDIAIESEVGLEVLGLRVGTIHPGFFTKPKSEFTYDNNPKSTAYINKTTEGVYYFAGGLFGGCSKEVVAMANTINGNIQRDLQIEYIAVWHDESHINRYFIDHPPTKLLSPEYLAPPNWPSLANIKHKIVPLDKNHAQLRSMD